MIPNFIACILLLSNSWSRTRADEEGKIFAITECEVLIETHKYITDALEDYVSKEEKRLSIIKRNIVDHKLEQIMAMKDVSKYMMNPLNAYTMIKRLTVDLSTIKGLILSGTENNSNITEKLQSFAPRLPSEDDLKGAALAIRRVQATYKLDIEDLAEGKIYGVLSRNPMSADDCRALSSILLETEDYYGAETWILKANQKYESEKNNIEYLDENSWSSYLDNVQNAIKSYKADPEKGHKGTYKGDSWESREHEASLCRGDLEIPHNISKRLTCFLMTDNSFLRLAPIKTEQLYIDPDIFIFHKVMSDEEIKHVQNLVKPNLVRARVSSQESESGVYSDSRVGKLAWLGDEVSEVVSRISRRVHDFTQLDMVTSEQLQIVNYGIGGHYVAHYDFDEKRYSSSISAGGRGNRFATVLFYMSEVEQGGATIFPKLGLSVFPIKNAALYWLNLLPSAEGDLSKLHGSCPVLRGSKWIATKWIHQVGQELLRPCNLEYQREEDVPQYPQGVLKSST